MAPGGGGWINLQDRLSVLGDGLLGHHCGFNWLTSVRIAEICHNLIDGQDNERLLFRNNIVVTGGGRKGNGEAVFFNAKNENCGKQWG